MTSPKDYLTDRVDEFTREFLGIDHFADIEAFLTETIQQSMEVGRKEGYTQGYTDGKNFDSRANEAQSQFNKSLSKKP